MIGRIHQEDQRHFESLRDLVIVELEGMSGLDQPDHWRHHETAAGEVLRHGTEHLDVRAMQPDLFFGLTQGGGNRRGIARFGAPAWKGHLPGVRSQVGGTFCQQDRQAGRSTHQRHQHGSRPGQIRRGPIAIVDHFGRPVGRLMKTPTDRVRAQPGKFNRRQPRRAVIDRRQTRVGNGPTLR